MILRPLSLLTAVLFLSAFGAACASSDSSTDGRVPAADDTADYDDTTIDADLLATYKRALPKREQMTVRTPEDVAGSVAPAGTAYFPAQVVPLAEGINGIIGGMMDLIEQIVAIDPSYYDQDTREFVWGPWDDEDSPLEGDTVAFYIKDQGEDAEDFRYVFAFLRGMSDSLDGMQPVIWGGATPVPDEEDQGVGVLLFDFEAIYAFEEANNPDHGDLTRGRFATVFAHQPDEENPDNMVTWVVAAFRDFVPEDNPAAEPASVDYLWGRIDSGTEQVDFLDFNVTADIDENGSAQEQYDIYLAFYNEGIGRAEAYASGGDIDAGYHVEAAECWDAQVAQDYFYMEWVNDGTGERGVIDPPTPVGSPSDCLFPELSADMPRLDNLDQDLLDGLDDVASNGVQD